MAWGWVGQTLTSDGKRDALICHPETDPYGRGGTENQTPGSPTSVEMPQNTGEWPKWNPTNPTNLPDSTLRSRKEVSAQEGHTISQTLPVVTVMSKARCTGSNT